jgi:hypothetical protein
MPTFSSDHLLKACMHAFNHLPRRSLGGAVSGFPDTYALASALSHHLREPASPVEWHIEIAMSGMTAPDPDDGSQTLASREGDVHSWDVELRLYFPASGEIHPLIEHEDLTSEAAERAVDNLAKLIPDASISIWPE